MVVACASFADGRVTSTDVTVARRAAEVKGIGEASGTLVARPLYDREGNAVDDCGPLPAAHSMTPRSPWRAASPRPKCSSGGRICSARESRAMANVAGSSNSVSRCSFPVRIRMRALRVSTFGTTNVNRSSSMLRCGVMRKA